MTAERAEIVAARLAELRGMLERHGAGALTLSTRRSFSWLTVGGVNHVLLSTEGGVAPVVVTGDRAVVLAPVNEQARLADEELSGLPLEVLALPWWRADAVDEHVAKLAAGKPALGEHDVSAELLGARAVLTATEHARLEWLAEAARDTVAAVCSGVVRGDTEHAIAGRLAERLARAAVRLPVVLVAADERIDRYRHPIPTDKRVERRAMIVVVAERWGLHAAHTAFVELDRVPPEAARAAAALRNVIAAMREATRPGSTLGDVLSAARAAYAENGIADQWELHHQGGTIGYAARERIAVPDDQTPILPGMAFAWNPSAVGYKLEQTLYLDASGGQHVLTDTPAS